MRIPFLLAWLLVAPAAVQAQETEVAALRAELAQLRAEIAEVKAMVKPSTPAPAAAATPPAPAAPVVQKQPAVSGAGNVTFSGLLQVWGSAGDAGFNDTMRIRRAELRLTGSFQERAAWTVMIDPSKLLSVNSGAVTQASRPLQDASITLRVSPTLSVVAGQTKLPLSLEGLDSSAALDTVERALFLSDRARGGGYGDVRDIGVMARGSLAAKRVDYSLGIFNGSGDSQNETDRNDRKTLAGRLTWRPAAGWQFGTSAAWDGGGDSANHVRRDRFGADALFTRDRLRIKAEYMRGTDGPIDREGYYAHVGWKLTPRIESIVRVDQWDPDTRSDATAASARERDYIAGLNFDILQKNLRMQAAAVRKTFAGDLLPLRNLLTINLQTSW